MINLNRAAVLIPEKLFFKIGEVCDITGVQAHVLRYWESEFPMLAPQKNRAGQRTYRKRDVEMALRIKELLYDDQYTIAGAKKRLASELRGASKLKMVTPEMSAPPAVEPHEPQLAAPPPPVPQSAPPLPQPLPQTELATPSIGVEARSTSVATTTAEPPVSGEQRTAIRRLSEQLHELLMLLDESGTSVSKPRKN
ncbi:MAG: MerR family transcriptional regulator [Pyrinomonadaceae bacterium]